MGIKLYMQIFNVKERKIFDLFFVFFKYRITYNFSFYYIGLLVSDKTFFVFISF